MEVNSCVNYPIKVVLVEMMENDKISTDPISCYCTSFVVIQVANVGISLFISSWNNHPIPGMFICVQCVLKSASTESVPLTLELRMLRICNTRRRTLSAAVAFLRQISQVAFPCVAKQFSETLG